MKEREEEREVEKAGGCYDTLQLLCYCVLGEIWFSVNFATGLYLPFIPCL